jgi:hypothetical protein
MEVVNMHTSNPTMHMPIKSLFSPFHSVSFSPFFPPFSLICTEIKTEKSHGIKSKGL